MSQRILTNNRPEYIQALRSLQPTHVIAPYGFEWRGLNNIKIITNKHDYRRLKLANTTWDVRQNNKVHAKLIIGKNGVLLGSWNFTPTSTNNKHEIAIVIYGTDTKEYADCLTYFNSLWRCSHDKEIHA